MNPNTIKFYKKNEVRIGKDYQTSIPYYYSSLDNAFKNFFDTFLDLKDSILALVDLDWSREGIGFNFGVSYKKIVSTIVDFHRFFELLIKDILGRINPLLRLKIEDSSNNIVNFHFNNIDDDELKTIEFGEAKKRLKSTIAYLKKNDTSNKFIQFEFLLSGESGIEELSWWRNRLIHNGQNIPNILALDYLVTQKIIPLVSKVISTEKTLEEKDYKPEYFRTKTGIEIIEKILRLNFTHNDFEKEKSHSKRIEFARKYIELYQLKALGRASMNMNQFLNLNINIYHEYHKLKSDQFFKIAKNQENDNNYLKTNECLCCGNRTLITYKEIYEDKIFEQDIDMRWSKCFICDYGISYKLGNPKDSNITTIDIFQ